MNYATDQAVLNDLPPTFKRPDVTYLQLVDSFTNGVNRFTNAADGVIAQASFTTAQDGWVDVFGLLFGIARNTDEATPSYMQRILFQVNAGGGPPQQIVKWIYNGWKITVQVVENLPAVGYYIIFPSSVTLAQINLILASLAYVRPAGVPLTGVFQSGAGLYLETINFLGAPDVIGAYLSGSLSSVAYTLGAGTNNAVPQLPDLLLTDPTLNPGLAA